jgi:hypothetical protein
MKIHSFVKWDICVSDIPLRGPPLLQWVLPYPAPFPTRPSRELNLRHFHRPCSIWWQEGPKDLKCSIGGPTVQGQNSPATKRLDEFEGLRVRVCLREDERVSRRLRVAGNESCALSFIFSTPAPSRPKQSNGLSIEGCTQRTNRATDPLLHVFSLQPSQLKLIPILFFHWIFFLLTY